MTKICLGIHSLVYKNNLVWFVYMTKLATLFPSAKKHKTLDGSLIF